MTRRNYVREILRQARNDAVNWSVRQNRNQIGRHEPASGSGRDVLDEVGGTTVMRWTVGYHQVDGTALVG